MSAAHSDVLGWVAIVIVRPLATERVCLYFFRFLLTLVFHFFLPTAMRVSKYCVSIRMSWLCR